MVSRGVFNIRGRDYLLFWYMLILSFWISSAIPSKASVASSSKVFGSGSCSSKSSSALGVLDPLQSLAKFKIGAWYPAIRWVRYAWYAWCAWYAWYGRVGALCTLGTVRSVRMVRLVRYAWYAYQPYRPYQPYQWTVPPYRTRLRGGQGGAFWMYQY